MRVEEAEMAAIGSCILSMRAAADLTDTLRPGDFSLPALGACFEAITALSRRKQAADLVTLPYEIGEAVMKRLGITDDYLIAVAESVPSPANSSQYRDIVKSFSRRRQLAATGHRLVEIASDEERDATAVIDEAQSLVMKLDTPAGRLRNGAEMAHDALARVDRVIEGEPEWGITTGLHDVDWILGPKRAGMLGIVAARTSMGKTSYVVTVALNVARSGNPVLIYQLEQPEHQLVDRFAQAISGVTSRTIRKAPTKENYAAYASAMEELRSLPITLADASDTSTQEVRAGTRSLVSKGLRPLVMVDYLGLMRDIERGDNRNLVMAARAKAMKRIAKDLEVPVIAFSQINRGVESRNDKRPGSADLRDSGEIEEAADWVAILYRDAYYKPKPETPPPIEVAEFIVAKNREGETGTKLLAFEPTERYSATSGPSLSGLTGRSTRPDEFEFDLCKRTSPSSDDQNRPPLKSGLVQGTNPKDNPDAHESTNSETQGRPSSTRRDGERPPANDCRKVQIRPTPSGARGELNRRNHRRHRRREVCGSADRHR